MGSCDAIDKIKKELNEIQETANCTIGLALLIAKIKYKICEEKFQRFKNLLIYHEFVEPENGVGWEECLQFHIQRIIKPEENDPKVLKTTKKLKSLLSTLLDQDINKLDI
jgi:hypothetical protein